MKETNMEHYRCEIEEVLESSDELPCLIDGKLQVCKGNMDCHKCDFSGRGYCGLSFVKWAMSEYKPEPVLTAREKHFVESLEDGWLTKGSASNEIKWWNKKPKREGNRWVIMEATQVHSILFYAFGIKLPFITREDEEPWSVEELRKLKVADEIKN